MTTPPHRPAARATPTGEPRSRGPATPTTQEPLGGLMARASGDPDVVGVVLSGSRARGQATSHSDTDVVVILSRPSEAWSSTHGRDLDVAVLSVADLADVSDRYGRYAFRGAQVLLDRLDGRIADLVHAQATLTPDEAAAWAREELDGYLNFVYRAAKNRRDGNHDLADLEEIDAAPWFLWTLFALYGRVRPYNKYLRWELTNFPLPAPWTADHLIATLRHRPSLLFPALEKVVEEKGHADVIAAWNDFDVVRRDVQT